MNRFPIHLDLHVHVVLSSSLRVRHHEFQTWMVLTVSLLFLALAAAQARAEEGKVPFAFPVKYVVQDCVYLVGGSKAGLAEGQKLTVRRQQANEKTENGPAVAEVEIESVALVSAVAKINSSNSPIVVGDIAFLSAEDAERLAALRASEEAGKYPQVVSFTEGNPPEQETRDSIPRPPSPEVNRVRGRIGIDFSDMREPSGGLHSWQFGYVLRIEATRLGGTFWRVSGFQRGRVWSQNSLSPQTTLRDLINRTYHLSLSYDKPGSPWVAGVGRLYVPWATSLSTIDGFYAGGRWGKTTVGGFGGTTPDPTSWNYNRHRQLFGGFVNYSSGRFESLRVSSTAGLAISRISWHPDRQFGFFENNIFFNRYLWVYSDVEADLRLASQNTGQRRLVFSRSFVSVRLQPHKIVTFDVNENYFRNIPTFDLRLVGTGLLDQYLFQGISGGVRLQLPYQLGIYGSLGRSSRTADVRASWNYLYGASGSNILGSGVRAEFRYSRFDSSFGRGSYKTLMLSRELGEGLRLNLQAGQQDLVSMMTTQARARFADADVDWLWRRNIILGAGLAVYRGQIQKYTQFYVTVGYRFDFHLGHGS